MENQFSEKDLETIFTALRFAAEKHRDQRRKGSEKSPYINHPIAVAEMLWKVGGVRDVTTLVAALLHDTVEDTSTKPDEILSLFGKDVLDLVLEVTDDKSLPKAERKRRQVESAPHKSMPARQIKLADKINNIRDITLFPPDDWSMERRRDYLDWTEQVINGLRGHHPALEAYYDRALAQAREELLRNDHA